MHPVIRQQLLADHIREIHARAEADRRARQARRPRRRAPSIRLSGVVAAVLGVVHTFGEQRPALARRGDGSIRMAALSKTSESALPKRAKNFSFRGRIITSA